MSVITPWAMDELDGEPEYHGAMLRRIFAGLLGAGERPTRARPGVLAGGDVVVSGDTVYVAECLVVVTTSDGSFITGLDSELPIALQARDATNPRRDLVVVQIHHTTNQRSAEVRVIAGTPTPSPQVPATPDGAEVLGEVEVPSAGGGPAAFTPRQRYTAARGGIITVPNVAALNRLPEGTIDEPAFASVAGTLYASAGNGWQPQGAATYQLTGSDVYTPASGSIGSLGARAYVTEYPDGSKRISVEFHQTPVVEPSTSTVMGTIAEVLRPNDPQIVTGTEATTGLIGRLEPDGAVTIRWTSEPGRTTGAIFFSSYTVGA